MLSAKDILKITKKEIKVGFSDSFPVISTTSPGYPIPLYNFQQLQQYWLVPFLLGEKVRGLAIYDLNGNLLSHGLLSPNVKEESRLLNLEFFEEVPTRVLDEIRQKFKEFEFAPPFFSFDETPRKWGWLLLGEKENEKPILIFIGPQGWYEKKPLDGREGI